jgi:uncharacterized protein (DUF433 family)
MSTQAHYPHLSLDADGTARIGSTRYKVIHIAAEHYQHGWSAEELLRQHPDLRPEEIYAALTYFYDHRDALVAEMKATLAASTVNLSPQPVTRDELLRRRHAQGG